MLTDDQRQRLIEYLASKPGLPIQVVRNETGLYSLGIPAEDCIMRRITKYQIDLIRENFKRNLREKFQQQYPQADEIIEAYMTSREIISFMLGHDWWTKNISDGLGINENRMEYLRLSLTTKQERYEHCDRIIDLADSLFLLQDCEGFDLKIKDLRKVSPEKPPEVRLEDRVIELQVAKMLVKSGHEIQFVAPSGIKPQDFDLQINFKKRTSISAEVKCKREDTAVNANSLRRTLYEAEKQLPRNNPNVVFARLPTAWIKDAEFVSQVSKVIRNFFRNVSHVNAIVFVWEEWVEFHDNFKGRILKYQLKLHPSPQPALDDDLNELLMSIDSVPRVKGTFLSLSFGEFSY